MDRSALWPLFGLTVTTPRLTMRAVDPDLAYELAGLAAQGIHDPGYMPFYIPWTDVPSPELERGVLRYYFRKKTPGGMRMKCLFPDQVRPLFDGVRVKQIHGVKLPLSGLAEAVLGRTIVDAFTIWFGKLPVLRYLSYALIVEAEKPATR